MKLIVSNFWYFLSNLGKHNIFKKIWLYHFYGIVTTYLHAKNQKILINRFQEKLATDTGKQTNRQGQKEMLTDKKQIKIQPPLLGLFLLL